MRGVNLAHTNVVKRAFEEFADTNVAAFVQSQNGTVYSESTIAVFHFTLLASLPLP